jgi:hypothetical protein
MRIALSLLAMTAALVLPTTQAEAGPNSGPTLPADFELTYCAGATSVNASCAWMESVLDQGGVWEHIALHIPGLGVLPYTLWGTWELKRNGKRMVIEIDDGFDTTYVGNKISANCWAGLYTSDTNPPTGGAWEGCVVP